jgi:hypothetical protein
MGFDVSSSRKRVGLAETISAGSGVVVQRGALTKDGPPEEVGDLIFDVIVAARGVGDLLLTARTYEPATFREEVAAFLERHGVPHESRRRVTGESGRIYTVDFWIPAQNSFLETLSPAQPGGIQATVNRVFRIWADIDGSLDRSKKFSLVNDVDFRWVQPDIALLQRVSTVSHWSRPDELAAALA